MRKKKGKLKGRLRRQEGSVLSTRRRIRSRMRKAISQILIERQEERVGGIQRMVHVIGGRGDFFWSFYFFLKWELRLSVEGEKGGEGESIRVGLKGLL